MVQPVDQLVSELKAKIEGTVKYDPLTLQVYSTDASDFRKVPTAVVIPRTVQDISAALQTTGRHQTSLIPRGGGSSLSGQTVGTGLIVDHSKFLNRILEVNAAEQWAWVESGVTLDRLNQALVPHGLMVGPDPASSAVATLGGMAGNNSTGAHSIKYGLMVDHVLEMDVVLSDGSQARVAPKTPAEIEHLGAQNTLEGGLYRALPAILDRYEADIRTRYPQTWRNVAGYNLNRLLADRDRGRGLNLASLIVGSEGTLACITRLKIKLVPRPARVRLLVLHFATLDAALQLVPLLLENDPAAVELMTYPTLKLAYDHPVVGSHLRLFLHGLPGAILIVELAGDSAPQLAQRAALLENKLQTAAYTEPIAHCVTDEEIGRVWSIRRSVLGLMASQPRETKRTGIIDDASVPVARMIDFTRAARQAGLRHGIDINFDAHASAGCLHMCPELNLKTPEGLKCLEQLAREIMAIAISLGGTTTGEHGEGLARSCFNRQLYGERLHAAFREVKAAFDPHGILNPHKIVDAREPWDPAWLKYHPHYRVPYAPAKTYLDFSEYKGFAGLVEMCSGMGVCRGQVHGGMCPSFRATGDEVNSTRGRANALRAALSGEFGPDGLTSAELREALDLCLECKACKAECAARVDMAKLKYEVLAHYQARHGVPLRSRLFGALAETGRLGGLAPGLTNRLFGSDIVRNLLDRTVGIDKRRTLPPIAPQTFQSWFRNRRRPAAGANGRVVLWDDCHISHHCPELGRDAVRVLEAAGFDVLCVSDRKCCGRPLISKGLLAKARSNARHNVDRLLPFARAGLPIIGVEPSCIACFRDEYPDLLKSAAAREVAAQSFFFEEFIASLADRNRLSLHFAIPPRQRRIMVHTHCYQKALGTAEPVIKMLRMLPDTQVEEIAGGCCGMAGAFGYEKEHYDLSMAIGEQTLFPAVRGAAADTIIAAAGTSCREQIKDGTQRAARHPISLLAEALTPPAG
jgi:FAD/FMN-containing dehydrogenase/Fe-S oxidoreductase